MRIFSARWTLTPTASFPVRLVSRASGRESSRNVDLPRAVLAGDELAAALQADDPTAMTEARIDLVMKALDTDGSGSISAAEFRSRLHPTHSPPGSLLATLPAIDTASSVAIVVLRRAREEAKLRTMKDLYSDMVETFEQANVCRSLLIYLVFTMICASPCLSLLPLLPG